MKIVYGFGANVAFVVALLIATVWAAYNTRAVALLQNRMPAATAPNSAPAPAVSPVGSDQPVKVTLNQPSARIVRDRI
ncbi:MAG: hypothetical protein SFU56_12530 [Capsulimonadales bacterium]|nr:hypothetical protein [Capsulimonadales bacterium]